MTSLDRPGRSGARLSVGILGFRAAVLVVAVSVVAGGAVVTAFERQARDVRVRLAGNEAAPTLETGVFAQALLPTRSRSLGLDAALAEPVDTTRAQAMLEDLLAEKPAFALGWQSLAQMRRLNGEPVAASLRALRMSALFGPAEGMAMMQRAVMGLEAWTSLAPADRRLVIRDLYRSAGDDAEQFQWTVLRNTLDGLDPAVRRDVRDELVRQLPASRIAMQKLGIN